MCEALVCGQSAAAGQVCSRERPMMAYAFSGPATGCTAFVFNGCGGNDNRFPTLAACAAFCLSDNPNGLESISLGRVRSQLKKVSPNTLPCGLLRSPLPQWSISILPHRANPSCPVPDRSQCVCSAAGAHLPGKIIFKDFRSPQQPL